MSNRFFDLEQELSQAKEVAQQGFSEARSVSADPSRNRLFSLAQHLEQVRSDIAESLGLAPMGQQFGDYDPVLDEGNGGEHPGMAVQMGLIIGRITVPSAGSLYTLLTQLDKLPRSVASSQPPNDPSPINDLLPRTRDRKRLEFPTYANKEVHKCTESISIFGIWDQKGAKYYLLWDKASSLLEIHDSEPSLPQPTTTNTGSSSSTTSTKITPVTTQPPASASSSSSSTALKQTRLIGTLDQISKLQGLFDFLAELKKQLYSTKLTSKTSANYSPISLSLLGVNLINNALKKVPLLQQWPLLQQSFLLQEPVFCTRIDDLQNVTLLEKINMQHVEKFQLRDKRDLYYHLVWDNQNDKLHFYEADPDRKDGADPGSPSSTTTNTGSSSSKISATITPVKTQSPASSSTTTTNLVTTTPTYYTQQKPDSKYQIDPKLKVTRAKIFKMMVCWHQAAISVGDRIAQAKSKGKTPDTWTQRKNLWNNLPVPPEPDKYVPLEEYKKIFSRKVPFKLAEELVQIFGGQTNSLSVRYTNRTDWVTPTQDIVRKEIAVEFIRQANKDENSWKTIDHKMWDPKSQKWTSSILTPVNECFHTTYAPPLHGGMQKHGTFYGFTGITSMNESIPSDQRTVEESFRTANCWLSELYDGDKQPFNEKLFSAFRSGTFCAYRESDKEIDKETGLTKRKQANRERALGVIEAMVIQELKEIELRTPGGVAEFLGIGGNKPKTALNIVIVSINLLSNTKFQGDGLMVEEHHETLNALNGRGHELKIKWEINKVSQIASVCVLPDIISFNFAVNQAATWAKFSQNQRNQASWEKLTVLREKISQKDNAKNRQIKLLSNRIESKEPTDGNQGNYIYPAMLANLAYLIGFTVHFNCKSGKDRTGLMDVECKFLARELAIQRQNQPGNEIEALPDVSLTGMFSKFRHQQMLWESGNLQILERNTRGQSLKAAEIAFIPGLNQIFESDVNLVNRLGKDVMPDLKGLAKYTTIVTKMLEGDKFDYEKKYGKDDETTLIGDEVDDDNFDD